jgi:hypothetical protein
MSPKQPTIAVTIRALMARINRKLAHEDQVLKVSRSVAEKQNLGNYHVVDTHKNAVVDCHIYDLEKWVRDWFPGMLRAYEKLEG